MKRRLLVVGAFALTAVMGVSLGASPVMKDIQAKLNPTIKYEINGESAMESDVGIVYEDKIYIPLRAAGEALGLVVDYEPGKVTMTSKEVVVEEEVTEEEATEEEVTEEETTEEEVTEEEATEEEATEEEATEEEVTEEEVTEEEAK